MTAPPGSARRTVRSRRTPRGWRHPRSCQGGGLDPPHGLVGLVVGLVVVATPDREEVVERVEVVDVELALEVVELVLQCPAEQPRAGDLALPALAVLRDHPDPLAASDVGGVARDRQATLEISLTTP